MSDLWWPIGGKKPRTIGRSVELAPGRAFLVGAILGHLRKSESDDPKTTILTSIEPIMDKYGNYTNMIEVGCVDGATYTVTVD
jgi:hypothetical protein